MIDFPPLSRQQVLFYSLWQELRHERWRGVNKVMLCDRGGGIDKVEGEMMEVPPREGPK
jgi:hypothetical protein